MEAEDDFVLQPPKPVITQQDDFGAMPRKEPKGIPSLQVPKEHHELVFAAANEGPDSGVPSFQVPKDHKELIFAAGSVTPDARSSPSAEEAGPSQRPAIRPVRRASSGLTQSQVLDMVLEFVNKIMLPDPDYKEIAPVNSESKLLEAAQDGILLSRLINHVVPKTIDEHALIHARPLTNYQKTENLRIALNGATFIGCVSMLITPHMILQGKAVLVIGLIDQLRKIEMLQHVNKCPELIELAQRNETLEDIYMLPHEELMIRWVNYHISKIPQQSLKVTNLGQDLKDGKIYTHLLSRLDPDKCNLKGLSYAEPLDRMKSVISSALKLGAKFTLSIDGLVQGSNVLHIVLCCMLFNVAHGLSAKLNNFFLRHEFLRSLGG